MTIPTMDMPHSNAITLLNEIVNATFIMQHFSRRNESLSAKK